MQSTWYWLSESERMKTCITVGLVLITALTYARVTTCNFIDFDDAHYVSKNAYVRGGLTPDNVVWALTTFHAAHYLPVTWLSFQLDAQVFGVEAWGFHFTNLILHIANVLLVFFVIGWITNAYGKSALVAVLFAVHPMHVESVAWITERKDVLFSFFGLQIIAAYAWYAQRNSWPRFALVLGAFAASLLSKPMLVTAPFLLLLLDVWPLRRWDASADSPQRWRQLMWLFAEKIPLFLLSGLVTIINTFSIGAHNAFVPIEDLTLWMRLSGATVGYVWYLSTTFVPIGLAILYQFPLHEFDAGYLVFCAAILLAITVLAAWFGRTVPALMIGWLWFLGTLVPTIGFSQVGRQVWADRFVYFPHIGLFIAVVWGAARLKEYFRVPEVLARLVTAMIVLALAVLSWQQVKVWNDSYTLWQHAAAVTFPNDFAIASVADLDKASGKHEEARRHYLAALAIRETSEYHGKIADLYRILGREADAKAHRDAIQKLFTPNANVPSRPPATMSGDGTTLLLLIAYALLLGVPSLWGLRRIAHYESTGYK